MKSIQKAFVLALILLSISTVSAQYGNNGYGNNGYGNGGYGGRSNQMNQNYDRTPEKPKEIPVEVTIGKIMEKLKPELNLDALQEIAISNVFAESLRSQGILMKAESSQEQKILEFKALSEITDSKVNEYLNEDQKIKYKALKEDNNKPKKSRKKK
jgi:hypothetical protein